MTLHVGSPGWRRIDDNLTTRGRSPDTANGGRALSVEHAPGDRRRSRFWKLYKKGKNAVAYILETAVTQTNTSEAQDLFEQGLELLFAGSAAKAACAFRTAITINPEHYDAHHGLIRALRDAGQIEQSIAVALALTALTPADPLAHTALSISLQQAGHVPEAEAAAARARIQEWRVQLQSPLTEGTKR